MMVVAIVLFFLSAMQELVALMQYMDIVFGPHKTRMHHGFVFSQLPALAFFCLGMLAIEKFKEFRKNDSEQPR